MANSTVSIIIPTSGKNPLLKNCLSSLKKLNLPSSKIQTIVITNQDLKKLGKEFSFARAVNQAAKKTNGKYLLITNDDMVFEKNSLSAWLKEAESHPNTLLGANIKTLNQKPAPAGYTMNLWTGIAKPVFTQNQPLPCDWLSGCAIFMERRIFRKLNGFNEQFSPGFFEDADFCKRAKKLGINCLLIPNAKATHAQTSTFNLNKPKKYEYWYRNKLLFLRKHASLLQLTTYLPLQYAIVTPLRAILNQDGRLLPALKGLTWNIKNYQKLHP